jgi:hypothetical protein
LKECGLLPGESQSPPPQTPPPSPPPNSGEKNPPPKDKGGGKVDELGPRGHQIMYALSEDGLNWTVSDEVIRDAGSVPEVLRLPNGDMLIYFVDGNSPAPGLLKGSLEEGWTQIPMGIENGPRNGIVDPDAVLLPDGRVRLFYLDAVPEDMNAPRAVYSAISEDGIHFTQEEGIRIAVQRITDPSVIRLPDGSWMMALSEGGVTHLAASPDGGEFTLTGVTLSLGGVPELTLLPDGNLRLFVSAPEGIRSLYSEDGGETWTVEEGLRIPAEEKNVAADPSVIQLPDGTWFMVWKRLNPALLNDANP